MIFLLILNIVTISFHTELIILIDSEFHLFHFSDLCSKFGKSKKQEAEIVWRYAVQSSRLIFGRIRLGAWVSISTPILFVVHTFCYELMIEEVRSPLLLILYVLQSCDHTIENSIILKNIKMMFLDLLLA